MKSSSANLSHHSTLFRLRHPHFRANFLPLWRVTTGEDLFAKVPSELIDEQCWERLVRVPSRPEVMGGEACEVSQGWHQEYVVHGIRFKAEVVGVYPGELSSAI